MVVELSESNLAGIGSEEDKALRALAAKSEEDFVGAGSSAGIEVWRIEKFEAEKVAKADYGTFYTGDSYIVLNTMEDDEGGKSWDLHFWLGAESTQDEVGSAAILTVNLDDMLGGAPVQFREVQCEESEEFKKIFPAMRYISGGTESGFKSVEPESYTPKLFQVFGSNPVRALEVPLSKDSLNNGDVFILDLGLSIMQWNAPNCSAFERNKASGIFEKIEEERGGDATTKVIDGDEIMDHPDFWAALGAEPETVAEKNEERAAEEPELSQLFKVDDNDGDGSFTCEPVEGSSEIPEDCGSSIYVLVKTAKEVEYKVGSECSGTEKFYVNFKLKDIVEMCGASSSAKVKMVK
eukprot:CAMPEP_0174892560 /NCGR_PEP_ID=MMETSP0167-20121228/7475_1 /TAXON_ID=38298 /ORGANISM="Rhodella maculata, Strain CCMP736" /LENGTH=350 /DNA_ID=CAMNT_0016131083 /DNA_START=83 /DNA_END=1135 /DNA_ORIENTATION=-